MEVPERIYFDGNDRACKLPVFASINIEYIRTGAFVEKALKYLDENFFFNNKRNSIESGVFDSKEEMFEDFKKYMNN